jgi:hypothetical protein
LVAGGLKDQSRICHREDALQGVIRVHPRTPQNDRQSLFQAGMLARNVRTDGFVDPCIPTRVAKAGEVWFIVMNCLDLGFDQSSAELPLKECALNRRMWVSE